MKALTFSIIGLGYIGKRHARLIAGNPNCKLAGVCDVNPQIKAEAVQEFGVPFFQNSKKMLEKGPQADVVCICTPNGHHIQHAIEAIEAGSHVLIEKPMGLTTLACDQLKQRANEKERKIFVVVQNRYSPTSQWLKGLVSQGILGKIHQVQVNCYWNRDERYYSNSPWKGTLALDGGPLFTQFSHFVDVLYWLFGEISEVDARFENFAHAYNTEFEDSGQVLFRLAGGAQGSLNYTTSVWDRNFESSLTIIAENGTVKVGGQYMEKIDYCHIKGYLMPELAPVNPPNDYGMYKGSAANHHFVFEEIVSSVTQNRPSETNFEAGRAVVNIIEQIYRLR